MSFVRGVASTVARHGWIYIVRGFVAKSIKMLIEMASSESNVALYPNILDFKN
jgi:hypothetical protein